MASTPAAATPHDSQHQHMQETAEQSASAAAMERISNSSNHANLPKYQEIQYAVNSFYVIVKPGKSEHSSKPLKEDS